MLPGVIINNISYLLPLSLIKATKTPIHFLRFPVIKKRKVSLLIKVGCTAYYNKKTFANGEVQLVYNWEHCNHDSTDPSSYISESRLSDEIKKWIVDAVDKHMDWESIKMAL
ncbi:hypothetical protein BDC45DRAFT_522508, partial [Circinella umbellata]